MCSSDSLFLVIVLSMPNGNLMTISLLIRVFLLCVNSNIAKYLLYRILCADNFIFVYFPRIEFAGSHTCAV